MLGGLPITLMDRYRSKAAMRENRTITKCKYTDVCYLAEALQCYGYKLDCILYTKSNGKPVTPEEFHTAINELIDKTKAEDLHKL